MIRQTMIGNLGRDPELRTTTSGVQVCGFSVAATSGFGDRKATVWTPVTVWGKAADSAARFLKKGSKVYVDGEVRERTYTNKEGQEVTVREVHVQGFDGLQFLDPPATGQQQGNRPPQTTGRSYSSDGGAGRRPPEPSPQDYDDELPPF